MFNDTILDHFQNPRNAGDLPTRRAMVEVTNPVCGDVLRLSARLEDGLIARGAVQNAGMRGGNRFKFRAHRTDDR